MTIKKMLLNRIIFGVIPIFILFGSYIYYIDLNFSNFSKRIDLIPVLFLLALFILTIDIIKVWKKLKKRNELFISPEFEDAPEFVDANRRFSFLDKTISVNNDSIDIRFKDELVLYLNKEKKLLELKNILGKKIIYFNDIDYLFLEYNQYQMYAPQVWLGFSTNNDKTIFKNSIIAKMKGGKELKIFDAKLHESDSEATEEYRITGDYKAKSYLSNGNQIIRLFSNYTNKKYFIIANN